MFKRRIENARGQASQAVKAESVASPGAKHPLPSANPVGVARCDNVEAYATKGAHECDVVRIRKIGTFQPKVEQRYTHARATPGQLLDSFRAPMEGCGFDARRFRR
ncbi:MAG TPA: hypothetical protein VMJ93_11750 [Verrucomicrobiae bacterium]|nr:hypothetical protein [Verrucomicrobiae bacterium]